MKMWKVLITYGLVCQVITAKQIDSGIIERNNYFNTELLQIVNDVTQGNIAISPLSVKTALSILSEGTGGRTREELLSALRLPSDQQETREISLKLLQAIQNLCAGTEINLANRLWIGQSNMISHEYNELLETYYGGDSQSIVFSHPASSDIINDWVRQATRNQIQSIVDPGSLGADMQLLLTSALYFRGKWRTAFDENATRSRCFNVPERGCFMVPTMEDTTTLPYAKISSLRSEVLEIPYNDEKLSMLIFLPLQEGLQHLQTLSRDLAHKPILELLNNLEETDIILQLPRLNIESKIDLQLALKYLGIRDLFDFNANLTGILPNGGARVGNVLHSAKFEINEQGTIASAATVFAITPLMGTTHAVFRVDRPFLFAIIDRPLGTIIFAGRVIHP